MVRVTKTEGRPRRKTSVGTNPGGTSDETVLTKIEPSRNREQSHPRTYSGEVPCLSSVDRVHPQDVTPLVE